MTTPYIVPDYLLTYKADSNIPFLNAPEKGTGVAGRILQLEKETEVLLKGLAQ
jgi:hypothetical protein